MAIDQVTGGLIKNDAITATKIAAGAVEIADVADDAITSAKIAAGAVDATALGSNAVTTVKINADAIDGTKIADNAVNSEHVTAGAIDTAHVGDDQITGAKIENNPTIAGNLSAGGDLAITGKTTLTGDFIPSAPITNKNMIINGSMQVAQRGNGPSSSTGGSGFFHTADRIFNFDNLVAANFTRETTNGVLGTESGNTFKEAHPYSWKFASNGTVGSINAGDRIFTSYKFEGQSVQHMLKGTANAKPVTLSFWVKSTQTGNHQVNLVDITNTRQIGATYAVSSAGTWEKKVITFAGDTTGAISKVANNQFSIEWWLTAGTTYTSGSVPTSWEANAAADRNAGGAANYVAGSGRTWQITGIQLELGSNCTPFEYRTYAEELRMCSRYFYNHTDGGGDRIIGKGAFNSNSQFEATVHFKEMMRDQPSLVVADATDAFRIHHSGSTHDFNNLNIHAKNLIGSDYGGCTAISLYRGGCPGTLGRGGNLVCLSNAAYVHFNAEI